MFITFVYTTCSSYSERHNDKPRGNRKNRNSNRDFTKSFTQNYLELYEKVTFFLVCMFNYLMCRVE